MDKFCLSFNLFTSFANDDKRERKLILHRNGFSNSPFPFNIGIYRFCFSFQYGLRILLCTIWNILQVSKNFNQFRRNLFVREWSRNYTSKSNSPSDKEKLTCNKEFLLSSQKKTKPFPLWSIFHQKWKLVSSEKKWVSTWILFLSTTFFLFDLLIIIKKFHQCHHQWNENKKTNRFKQIIVSSVLQYSYGG